ncbi:butyrophilin-like protein 2, partial [Larimichthys crocea]|uniref:butyrophilin-like protein 2 n=1 Tax=Larimichthys crocea TaxID=215358 RepID=UPI000F5E0B1A
MLQPKIQPSDGLSFRTCSVFIFMVLQSVGEQAELICSHQPIVALAGDDVILPCYLEPPIDADSETVIWTRPGLDPKYIHYHQDGRLVYRNQNPSYHYRTRLFEGELENGNVSMKIFTVKLSDAGKYFCILDSMMKYTSIQLSVGVVSTPVIEFVSNQSREVVLQCEAKGWYPEPEVFWLDAEGNLLSAGPTETVRGPDDLYTVSRRLTVKKSDSFTCRVQQKNITQTRETHFYVPGHFFPVQSLSWTDIIFTLVLLLVILLICFWAERKLRTIMKLIILHKNTKASQTNGSDCAMLHKEDEQRDNQEATEDEMTTEQTSNNQKNLKPSITLQKSHEEPNVRSQSENRRDGGTVEETVQTPGQCCGEIAEVNVEVRREESVQEPLMSDADVSIEQRCIKYW